MDLRKFIQAMTPKAFDEDHIPYDITGSIHHPALTLVVSWHAQSEAKTQELLQKQHARGKFLNSDAYDPPSVNGVGWDQLLLEQVSQLVSYAHFLCNFYCLLCYQFVDSHFSKRCASVFLIG